MSQTMRVETINPFVTAAFHVIEAVLGVQPTRGQLAMRPTIFTSQQCNIVAGVTGMVDGQVIYGMSLGAADRIASKMLGQRVRTFDMMAASAIAELGNMITGNALSILSENGYVCDISPPTLIRGTNVRISTLNHPALVVPIGTEFGNIEVTVCLRVRGETPIAPQLNGAGALAGPDAHPSLRKD